MLTSVITAAFLVFGSVAAGRPAGRRPPNWLVWLPASGLGLLAAAATVSEIDLSRYLDPTVRGYHWWTGPVAAAGLALHAGGVFRSSSDRWAAAGGGRVDLGPIVAGVTCGIFLCVPETIVLRLLVGPIVIAVVASFLGWLRPLGRFEAIAIGTVLAWIAVVDGQSRTTAVIGAAGALAATGVLMAFPSRPRLRPDPGTRQRRTPQPTATEITLALTAVLIARLGGLRATPAAAVAVSIVIVAAAAAVLAASGRRADPVTPSTPGPGADAESEPGVDDAATPAPRPAAVHPPTRPRSRRSSP